MMHHRTIEQHLIETGRIVTAYRSRPGEEAVPEERTIVFVHGNLASSAFFDDFIGDLPRDVRAIAIDLRGFGASEHAPVDATRGLRDFSDDLRAALDVLGIERPHLFGWALGGGVVMQYALDHPVRSLTLQAPVSPYGLGGTRLDGSRLSDDDAGCGAGAANPELVERLITGDESDDAAASPRSMFRALYVAPGFVAEHEDALVASMLTTSTATGNYPGDSVPSPHWPGFAPGRVGVLNALAPQFFDVSGLVALEPRPPVLWVRGDLDPIISDASLCDANHLGALGIVPDWPGADAAPSQPMVSQTRDVLAAYERAGGEVLELALDGVGHSPHLERPAAVRAALLAHLGYVGQRQEPAPPTEAIILRSAD